jgi:hypothetical protein
MTDLHETRDPKPTAQIDTLGWLFLAFAAAIIAAATVIAYHGNSMIVANTTLSRAAGPPS